MERKRSIGPPNKALEPTAGYPGKLHAGASGRRLKVGRPFGAVDVLFRDQYHTLLMKQTDMDALEEVIRSHWPYALDAKAERYLNKFFDRTRVGNGIAAKVVG